MNNQDLEKLKQLQSQIDELRRKLGITAPGVVLYQSRKWDDSLILVEADGYGGATTLVVEGNYPIDYVTRFEKSFHDEHQAGETAEKLANAPIREILGEPA